MPVAEYILPAISLIVGLNARAIGMRLGVIDYPLRGHKTHKEPTPLVGGIAVALPLLTYCMLFWWTHPESFGHAALAFAIGGAFLLGFIDIIFLIRDRQQDAKKREISGFSIQVEPLVRWDVRLDQL